MGRHDRRKALRPARPAAAEDGHRITGYGKFGGDIDPAFVEDPLTGGTVNTPRRGCFRIRRDEGNDRPRKGS